jgi:hypothetical protein
MRSGARECVTIRCVNRRYASRAYICAALILATLATSALALAVAPALMPEGYSWVEHTTSESGAQGTEGAWLARCGFVLFSIAVLTLAAAAPSTWSILSRAAHGLFGACMLVVAAFSVRPWLPEAEFDATEDLVHSVAATAMGFAFALGVVLVALTISRRHRRVRWFDAGAVVAAVVLPVAMTLLPGVTGVLQRVMFAVAYAWYAREALQNRDVPAASAMID